MTGNMGQRWRGLSKAGLRCWAVSRFRNGRNLRPGQVTGLRSGRLFVLFIYLSRWRKRRNAVESRLMW